MTNSSVNSVNRRLKLLTRKICVKSVHNFFLSRIFSAAGVNEEKLLITSVSCIYLESKEFFRIVIAVVMLIDRSFWSQISSF